MLRTQLKTLEPEDGVAMPLDAAALPANAGEAGAKKKVTLVIAHLGPGGAQRVAVNAANTLVGRGFDVHVIEINTYDRSDAYELDGRVIRHARETPPSRGVAEWVGERVKKQDTPKSLLLLRRSMGGSLRLATGIGRLLTGRSEYVKTFRWLREKIALSEPDAVLSFLTQTNILVVLATRGMAKRVVISERNDPRLQRHRFRVEFLRRIVYPWADLVTANSKGALDALRSFVPEEKLAFLPNPLAAAPASGTFPFAGPTVITVGRLVEQKGIDVLLAAWAKVASALPQWRLALVGDGPLGDTLKEQARTLGIDASIDWIGHVADPFPYLRGAKMFVMTSRFEGTPNALIEAMACGLPAVISDASPGPCELIGDGDDAAGLIVPVEDATATADAIIRLASDETLRTRLGLASSARARAHDADEAIDVWLKLLDCE
jgi:glycosyltransferase involved in cell wall biosynthesis